MAVDAMKALGLLAVVMLAGTAMPVEGLPMAVPRLANIEETILSAAPILASSAAQTGCADAPNLACFGTCQDEVDVCQSLDCAIDRIVDPGSVENLLEVLEDCVTQFGGILCISFSAGARRIDVDTPDSGYGVIVDGAFGDEFRLVVDRNGDLPRNMELTMLNPAFGTLVLNADFSVQGCA